VLKRLLVPAVLLAVVLSVLAFRTLSPVLAAAVLIGSVTLVAVLGLSADWEKHPSFEERELARSRRRREKWERTADARAKDRARWEAHQAKKAAKEQRPSS
jgi:hypothetical protein